MRDPQRSPIQPKDERELLLACGRRCALCYGLKRILRWQWGQIAHVNRNPADSRIQNLCYLCLACHDDYDSKRRQTKNMTEAELRAYRDQVVAWVASKGNRRVQSNAAALSFYGFHAARMAALLRVDLQPDPKSEGDPWGAVMNRVSYGDLGAATHTWLEDEVPPTLMEVMLGRWIEKERVGGDEGVWVHWGSWRAGNAMKAFRCMKERGFREAERKNLKVDCKFDIKTAKNSVRFIGRLRPEFVVSGTTAGNLGQQGWKFVVGRDAATEEDPHLGLMYTPLLVGVVEKELRGRMISKGPPQKVLERARREGIDPSVQRPTQAISQLKYLFGCQYDYTLPEVDRMPIGEVRALRTESEETVTELILVLPDDGTEFTVEECWRRRSLWRIIACSGSDTLAVGLVGHASKLVLDTVLNLVAHPCGSPSINVFAIADFGRH